MNEPRTKPGPGAALLWVLAGAVLAGLAWESMRAALAGGLIGWMLARQLQLRAAVAAMERRERTQEQLRRALAALERREQAPAQQGARPPVHTVTPEAPVPVALPPAAEPSAPVAPSRPDPAPGPAARAAARSEMRLPAGATAPRAAARPPAADDWLGQQLRHARDWLRGGNPLARVGIVVLFFGGAFLASYTARLGLFPLEARLAALALGAIVLTLLGWRLRQRRPVFAQILQGGGIAGFYLVVHAAGRVLSLLPPGVALALLVLVALAAGIMAVVENSLTLAFIGTVGGFLAPLLMAQPGGSHVLLFAYDAVLVVAVAAMAWFRQWRALNIAAFVLVFLTLSLFRATGYTDADRVSTDAFVLLFFALFLAIPIIMSWRRPPSRREYVSSGLVFGTPVAASALHASLVADIPYAMAWSALGASALYVALAWLLHGRGREGLQVLATAFVALAVVFATLAIPLAFDARTTTALWAIEGAGALWLGLRQRRLLPRLFGLLLQFAGGLGWLRGAGADSGDAPVLNGATLGALLLAVAGLASARWLWRHRRRLHALERPLHWLLATWGAGWWVLGGLGELVRVVPDRFLYGSVTLFWAGSALLAAALAWRLRWRLLDHLAWLGLGLGALWGFAASAFVAHPAAQLGWLGWPALLAVTWGLLRWREGRGRVRSWFAAAQPALHVVAAVLALWALAAELDWQLRQLGPGVWHRLPWGLLPLVAVGLAMVRPRLWPWRAHARLYGVGLACGLVLFSLAWTVGVNLESAGEATPLPWLPLLNPLDIACALVLAVAAAWWAGLGPETRQRLWSATDVPAALLPAGVAFIWLTAALLRALHHLAGVPWQAEALFASFLVQAALSIFWGLIGIGLVVAGARRTVRGLWLAGATLLGVVVLKLFLVDLAGSETLARIVSFLGVGVLLLVGGWLAPLPPRRVEKDA